MIDLHNHSTCSDGTLTPEELAARGSAFALHALTDHDTCDGVARFLSAPVGAKRRLGGIELSVEPGEGYGIFHLLGLGLDPSDAGLRRFLDAIRAGRRERNGRILRNLAALGMAFDPAELDKYANGEIVARPHIARVLVDHGWAESVKDAFDRFLARGAAAYAARYRPAPERAIATIHAAGGIAVMAHPRFWATDYEKLVAGLKPLRDVGLDGLEAYYQANLPGETIDHLRAAEAVGLLATAGSDFHGANKPTVTIGMTVPEEERLVSRLLSRLESFK